MHRDAKPLAVVTCLGCGLSTPSHPRGRRSTARDERRSGSRGQVRTALGPSKRQGRTSAAETATASTSQGQRRPGGFARGRERRGVRAPTRGRDSGEVGDRELVREGGALPSTATPDGSRAPAPSHRPASSFASAPRFPSVTLLITSPQKKRRRPCLLAPRPGQSPNPQASVPSRRRSACCPRTGRRTRSAQAPGTGASVLVCDRAAPHRATEPLSLHTPCRTPPHLLHELGAREPAGELPRRGPHYPRLGEPHGHAGQPAGPARPANLSSALQRPTGTGTWARAEARAGATLIPESGRFRPRTPVCWDRCSRPP